jgi:uncharacterized protein
MPVSDRIEIDRVALARLCDRWQVLRLEAFGSVLRDDFRPDSDIDLLVTFQPQVRWSLFDMVRMEREFGEALGRTVDLVERRAIEESRNHIRRESILRDLEILYVAG